MEAITFAARVQMIRDEQSVLTDLVRWLDAKCAASTVCKWGDSPGTTIRALIEQFQRESTTERSASAQFDREAGSTSAPGVATRVMHGSPADFQRTPHGSEGRASPLHPPEASPPVEAIPAFICATCGEHERRHGPQAECPTDEPGAYRSTYFKLGGNAAPKMAMPFTVPIPTTLHDARQMHAAAEGFIRSFVCGDPSKGVTNRPPEIAEPKEANV